MDTVNLIVVLKDEITNEERIFLKSKRWIKSIKAKSDSTYKIGISFPQYFYVTNAYLLTKQSEVDEVIRGLDDLFHQINNKIIEANLVRVDYPFTYLIEEPLEFNSYTNLLEILGKSNKMASSKSIEETKLNNKETYTFADNKNIRRAKNKVVIYNQAQKLKDLNLGLYESSKKEFPNLDQRMRIEASLEVDQDWYKLDLKEVKENSYNFIDENIFNEDNIEEFINTESNKFSDHLIEERSKGNINHSEFIYKEAPLSYEIVKKGSKKAYPKARGREEFLKSSKKIFVEKFEKEKIIYIGIPKEIKKIKNSLKEETKNSTK